MRALGVSLVAVSAVAASLTLARQRADHRRPDLSTEPAQPVPVTIELDLDAIRTAGF